MLVVPNNINLFVDTRAFYMLFYKYFLDIRFAAHGSPYYAPEKMEGKIAASKLDIERQLGMQTTIKFVIS